MNNGKFSEEITQEICKYLRAGNNQKDSALLSGISEDTYYAWMKSKPEFSEPVKKAELECKARNIAIIQRAAETTWQAAAWYLERKYHNEFALKQVQEMVGEDGKEILVKLITEADAKSNSGSTDQELPSPTNDL